MNALLKLAAFDLRLYMRDWLTIFWLLIYPVLMLLLFGSIFGNEPDTSVEGLRYIDSYVPALCAMNVMSVSLFTLNINIVTYRENGIFRRFRVTPVRPWPVLASHAVQGALLVFAGAVEIVVIAKLVWDIPIDPFHALLLLASMALGCLGFFGLGFALSGLSNSIKAATGLAMVVFFPMLFLSGVTFPIEMMPKFVQTISECLPMTYFVSLMQGVWKSGDITAYGTELLVLAGLAVVCTAAAVLLFRWEN